MDNRIKSLNSSNNTPNPTNNNVVGQIYAVKNTGLQQDTVELSSKPKKDDTAKILAVLGAITLAAVGGVKLGMKAFSKESKAFKFTGIQKGDIQDELYQFIQKNDPKGRLFNNKEEILKLDKITNENNLAQIKKMTLMNNNKYHTLMLPTNEITKIAKELTPTNTKFLDDLLITREGADRFILPVEDISTTLRKITDKNVEVAPALIKRTLADTKDYTSNEWAAKGMQNILDDIEANDTLKKYKFLIDNRKNGDTPLLSTADMFEIGNKINDKNVNSFNHIYTLGSKEGLGHKFDAKELKEALNHLDDELLDTYLVFNKNSLNVQNKIKYLTEDNADVMKYLEMNATAKSVDEALSIDSKYFKQINAKNKGVVGSAIQKEGITNYTLEKIIKKSENDPQYIKELQEALNKAEKINDLPFEYRF